MKENFKSEKMNRTQFIKEVVLNDPLLIPSIMKDNSYDKKITKGIMYKMLPFRSSIEIEANGSLLFLELLKINKNFLNQKRLYGFGSKLQKQKNQIKNKFNVLSYSEECLTGESFSNRFRAVSDGSTDDISTEFKISIRNYSQLSGLYIILNELKKNCFLNPKSGSHIHIDVTPYVYLFNKVRSNLTMSLEETIDETMNKIYLNKVKPLLGRYPGRYNKACWSFHKGQNKINYRGNYGSIEFRTVPMTFEYTNIVKYMVGLNQIVKKDIIPFFKQKVKEIEEKRSIN